MEIQLQELLERIHSEGIENAKQQAEEIIQKAHSEAAEIVARARRDAEEMQSEALKRIDAMEAASRESLLQASRDTMIALRQSVQRFLDSAIRADVKKAFDEKMAAQVIPEVLKILSSGQSGDFEVLLPPEQFEKIDSSLSARLAKNSRGVSALSLTMPSMRDSELLCLVPRFNMTFLQRALHRCSRFA